MEFEDLCRERMNDYQREWGRMQLIAAAGVGGHAIHFPNPVAGFDRLVLRMSKGASERQARRGTSGGSPRTA